MHLSLVVVFLLLVVATVVTSDRSLVKDVGEWVLFPRVVLQTRGKSMSKDMRRWREGCQKLNEDHQFKLFDDSSLMQFVTSKYPQYLQLFESLSGVYMADMARMLLVYHYGGLYIDLDFHCHKPFACLHSFAMQRIAQSIRHTKHTKLSHLFHSQQEQLQSGDHINASVDVLVVSREPRIQSLFIHKRTRCVIQDFFLSTPRHPFMKWMLDHVNDRFLTNQVHISRSGPFSYNIEKYLDVYYAEQEMILVHDNHNESLVALHSDRETINASKVTVIYELPSEVVHPLIDASNSKLTRGCQKRYFDPHDVIITQACDRLQAATYLTATNHTMLTHMWTHSYLQFSFLRGWYDQGTYAKVEKSLPPTHSC